MKSFHLNTKYSSAEAHLLVSEYAVDGTLAVAIFDSFTNQLILVASANLSETGGYPPSSDTFFLKSYSENEGLLECLVSEGVVEDTGIKHRSGFIDFPLVRLLPEWKASAMRC